jgi:hypothetical protein
MATMSFSIPDGVKEASNRTFSGRNKSAIVAELMERAVEEEELRERRSESTRRLRLRRSTRPKATDGEIAMARERLRR